MSVLRIRGEIVQVDITEELMQFEWGPNSKWTTDKLIARSPFRYDKSPSFFVRLVDYGDFPAGTWADSGYYDSEWASGNIVKLLAFLRHETVEEVEEYLIDAYGYSALPTDDIKLRPIRVKVQRDRKPLSEQALAGYGEQYDYLKMRGISEQTQRQAGVLYAAKSKAAVFPWRLANGRLANIKHRQIRGKVFWYVKGAIPIRELVYGMEKAGRQTIICEAEIDALSWRQAGFSAIATGGASFNEYKRDMIVRSGVEELIIATDNDKPGEKLREEIERMMRGHVRIRQAYIDVDVKDANEALVKLGVESLRESVNNGAYVKKFANLPIYNK